VLYYCFAAVKAAVKQLQGKAVVKQQQGSSSSKAAVKQQ
jgi:hypothetical protein